MTTGRINQVAVTRAATDDRLGRPLEASFAVHPLQRTPTAERASRGSPGRTTARRRNVATRPKPASVLLLQIAAATAEVLSRRCASGRRSTGRLGKPSLRRPPGDGAAALFHSRSGFPLRDPNLQDGRVGKVTTPTGDSSVPGESRPTLGALHLPRLAGWTIVSMH